MKQDRLWSYMNGRHCEILGLGVSNLPLARLLCDMGVSLTVRDKKSIEDLGEVAQALSEKGVHFVTGEHYLDDPKGDLIFRSPGIRPDHPGLCAAVARGAELTSEIELFLQLTDAMTFAITGSDGKTTSTTLTGKFLSAESERKKDGKVLVGGNIGAPLLDRLAEATANDRAVMELSSFQLMKLKKAPDCVAITNISPNHLDWHRDMEEYIAAKKNIVGKTTRRLVTNTDNPTTATLAKDLLLEKGDRPDIFLFSSSKQSFSQIFSSGFRTNDRALYIKNESIVIANAEREEILLDCHRIRVPGRHNLENFMTAIGLTYSYVDPSVYTEVADAFTGVEHRLELVRTLNGIDYFNSSIDSSPTRTAAALSALKGRDIVAICGGYDKKIPFEPLAQALCHSVRAVVLTGATAPKIKAALLACPDYRDGAPLFREVPVFEDAVKEAKALAVEGGCVLLSPACASFDAFRNFAERGKAFRQIVKNF